MTDPFIHLRVHSAYSIAQGAIQPKDLVKLAVKNGMPAVAITDTGNLFGTLEFAEAAVASGVQPIVGCVIAVTRPDAAQVAAAARRPGKAVSAKATDLPSPDNLLLLAQTEAGWRNLMALSSKGYLGSAAQSVPQVAMDDIAAHSEGLICLAGAHDSAIGRLLAEGRGIDARDQVGILKGMFGDRLYLEVMRHPGSGRPDIEDFVIDLAYANDVPLVATNDVHFTVESMQEPTEALLAISAGRTLIDPERPRLTRHHRFKSSQEMDEIFADLPEAVANARLIAQRIAFRPPKRKPILPNFPTERGRSEAEELADWARSGLEERLARLGIAGPDAPSREAAKPYRDRLEYEIRVICDMGFAGYFLIVSDFIRWTKARDIPVGPGRGSGAGSVVAWSLTITDLDPLRWGLLFERFLNPERVSMPDFDIDFCQERRDEVIRYVRDRYGADRVAQIITFGSLKARAAIRDVGRVIGMNYGAVDAISKLIPNNPNAPVSLRQAIDADPRLQELAQRDAQASRLFSIASQIEGLYRNASTHAAGVVIGDRPLVDLVPLFQDPKANIPATQYSMKWVEQAGLVKFDFLGLKTLTVLHMACKLARAISGKEVDISTIPLDDAKSYELMARADVTGVFQLESGGMRDILLRLKPDRLEDIIAIVALYRPGPMENIPDYVACKRGEQEAVYLHPSLEPVLAETFGIPVYQEQVMKMAQVLAGYSLGGADLLRRAMGKKIQAEMDAQRKTFIDGAVANGVDVDTAEKVFNQVDKFAGYGFNKSHAAAYALISYQTAYMKANHPVAFMAASMTYEAGDTDKLAVFAGELRRMGIKLLPPDVNSSASVFMPEMHEGALAIRYGLCAVKGLGEVAMSHLVAERQANGPFQTLEDLAWRIGSIPGSGQARFTSKEAGILAAVGAFSSIHGNAAEAAANADLISKFRASGSKKPSAKRDVKTLDLFAMPEAPEVDNAVAPKRDGYRLSLVPTQEWSQADCLKHEREHIGFFLSRHPVLAFESLLARLKPVKADRLPLVVAAAPNKDLRCAVIVLGVKERVSQARGTTFWIVTLSDDTGIFEALAFDSAIEDLKKLHVGVGEFTPMPIVCAVRGRVDEERLRLTIGKVATLEEMAFEHQDGRILVTVGSERTASEVMATLEAHRMAAEPPVPSALLMPHEPVQVRVAPPAEPIKVRSSFKEFRSEQKPPARLPEPRAVPRPIEVKAPKPAGRIRELELVVWSTKGSRSFVADGLYAPSPEVWKSLRRIPGVTDLKIVEPKALEHGLVAASDAAAEKRPKSSNDFKAA